MKKYYFISLILTALTIQISAQNTVTKHVLDNGFTVILNEDHRNPSVFGAVVTKAGAKDDPDNATGMAHYMEHMLFKGTTQLGTSNWEEEKPYIEKIFALYDSLANTKDTEKRKNLQKEINELSIKAGEFTILNEFSDIIKLMGGSRINAYTTPDLTAFFNEFPPNQINQWLDLYSHRFIEPVFRAFQAELEVVYEEKNMYEDGMIMKIIETFSKSFFKNHPYGQRSMLGTVEDLKNPSLTKMHEFFKKWYVANNMALVLSGDFDSEQILPVIQEKFGVLPSGQIPERKKYVEEPFNGRELIKDRLFYIKGNIMGFRVPSENDRERYVIDVISRLLNNSNSTGYFDQLMLDNKLLAVFGVPLLFHDYGCFIVIAVPKIAGQKLKTAEKLALEQIEHIKKGDFTDEQLAAIKNEFYREKQITLESSEYKAITLAHAFASGVDLDESLNITQHIQNITREDIINAAQKYLGDNYLILQSKMGFPKKDKIDKPGFEPVVTKTDTISDYRRHFNGIETLSYSPTFVNFTDAVKTKKLADNLNLVWNKNTENDIFTLQIRFGTGTYKIKELSQATEFMNLIGIKDLSSKDLKQKLASLGIEYNFTVDDNYTTLSISGIEKNITEALPLINKLMNNPEPDEKKLKTLYSNEQMGRFATQRLPDVIALALAKYALYGNRSSFIDRMTMKEIKKMKSKDYFDIFKKATQYEATIFFTGNMELSDIELLIKDHFEFNNTLSNSSSPEFLEPVKHTENTVYFIPKRGMLQTQIYLSTVSDFSFDEYAMLEALNIYLGGDFSGLLMQEIREYRSMAYSTYGGFKIPVKKSHPTIFTAFVGTQSDKANEAMHILDSIITQMPQKPERIETIREYLVNKTITQKPTFRELSQQVELWKNHGYTTDPREELINKYKQITWDDLYVFYKKMLKDNKLVWSIVGDKSRINLKEVEKYGKVVKIKEKQLFSK